jgi:formate dehydrogenase major subunit
MPSCALPASLQLASATSAFRHGTNIYRGHDNVQGATDVGPNRLAARLLRIAPVWKHSLQGGDYEWIVRFQAMMEKPGTPSR